MRALRRLRAKTRRINKTCLAQGHDWDVFGHPNWVCSRWGCSVRGDDFGGRLISEVVPVSDS